MEQNKFKIGDKVVLKQEYVPLTRGMVGKHTAIIARSKENLPMIVKNISSTTNSVLLSHCCDGTDYWYDLDWLELYESAEENDQDPPNTNY